MHWIELFSNRLTKWLIGMLKSMRVFSLKHTAFLTAQKKKKTDEETALSSLNNYF